VSAHDGDAVPKFEPVPVDVFIGDELPEPRWAVRDVWPEGASGIIAGRPKDGKSTLAVELAVSLWSGTSMFGLDRFEVQARGLGDLGFPTYSDVLYVQQENSTQRVQRDLREVLAARNIGDFVVDDYVSVESLRKAGLKADEPIVVRHFELHDEEAHEANGTDFHVLSQVGLDLSLPGHSAALAGLIEQRGYDYVFLDPLYMLIGAVDEKDSAQLKPVLSYLSGLRDAHGCGVIATHHMTDKGGGNEASRMLGSTYIHAWYEAALLVRRTGRAFEVKADAQRSHGQTATHTLVGRGVGRWHYDEQAQDTEDSLGRSAPRVARKEANIGLLATLKQEHPDWTAAQLAVELGVSEKTVGRYQTALEERPVALTGAALGRAISDEKGRKGE
jgi:hypothetical protein